MASGDDEDEDDEDEDGPVIAKPKVAGADLPAKGEGERTCESCYLIKPLIQFPDDGPICIDCS